MNKEEGKNELEIYREQLERMIHGDGEGFPECVLAYEDWLRIRKIAK
jgi:hypothetical protein